MREIKFRAWLRSESKHVYTDDWKDLGLWGWHSFLNRLGEETGYTPELQQYTGLKDKRGVEIYESNLTHAAGSPMMFRVEFYQSAWVLVPHHTHSKEAKENWEAEDGTTRIMPLYLMLKNGGLGDLEVIGNTYESQQPEAGK